MRGTSCLCGLLVPLVVAVTFLAVTPAPSSSELGTWAPTGRMAEARHLHTATLLC